MLVKELLVEDNNGSRLVSNEFDNFLRARGYQSIARGSKLYYRSPKSSKILVVANPSADQEFTNWVKFCGQQAGNPHFPRYSKLRVISFPNPQTNQQEQYTTVFTEELMENRRGIAIDAIEQWAYMVEKNSNIVFSKALEAFLRIRAQEGVDTDETLEDLYDQVGGYQQLGSLFHAVKNTVIAGQRLGYDNDLLDDNIMLNPAGTLVINDPWAKL